MRSLSALNMYTSPKISLYLVRLYSTRCIIVSYTRFGWFRGCHPPGRWFHLSESSCKYQYYHSPATWTLNGRVLQCYKPLLTVSYFTYIKRVHARAGSGGAFRGCRRSLRTDVARENWIGVFNPSNTRHSAIKLERRPCVQHVALALRRRKRRDTDGEISTC